MDYNELQQKIADVESMIDVRYKAAMEAYHKYWCECIDQKKVVMKPQPLRSQFEHQAQITIEKLRKEYAMQNTPADVGDIIEAEIKIGKGGSPNREIIRTMRIERIEVAAFEEPQLTYYGTYLRRDGTPISRQLFVPIYQKDITRVIKSNQ